MVCYKDIIFVPTGSDDQPLTYDTPLIFKLQRFSGEYQLDGEGEQVLDGNGNPIPIYDDVTNLTAETYFKETEPLITYTVETASNVETEDLYNVAKYVLSETEDKYGEVYSIKVKGLPAGTYKLDNLAKIDLSDPVTVTGPDQEVIFVIKSNAPELAFGIMKQAEDDQNNYTYLSVTDVSNITVSKYYEEVVTKDKNGTQLRLEYFPKNINTEPVTRDHYDNPIGYEDTTAGKTVTSANGTFNIPANFAFDKKISVLVQGLDAANTYTVTDGTAVRRPAGNNKVDLLVTKTFTDTPTDFTFTVSPSSSQPLTAIRYFVSDENGIVKIPTEVSNFLSLAEHLDYGVSQKTNDKYGQETEPSEHFNGLWEKYYYTVAECDQYGLDDHSSLTFGQKEISNNDLYTSKKMTFILDTSSYHQANEDPRKYLNIKIVNTSINGRPIVKRDINGDALKVTIWNNDKNTLIGEYYASDEINTIPAEGVIVIPIPVYCDSLRCEVEGLPYGIKRSDGSDWDTQYDYTVERCKATGKTHNTNLPLTGSVSIQDTAPQHRTVTFSYEKSWDKSAKFYHLRPDTVYFGLYRRYEGETNEETVKTFSEAVSSDTVSGTTKDVELPLPDWLTGITIPLAAGRLVHVNEKGELISDSEQGIDVWKPYTYYLKEYTDTGYNVEKSYNNPYTASYLYEPDKPFVLDKRTYTYADLHQGLTNKLQKTKQEVHKY